MSVYFLDCPMVNRIKIGTATIAEERIEAVRLMCPAETNLLGVIGGGYKEEHELHLKFSKFRRYGEWFEGTSELREKIWNLCVKDLWGMAPPEWRERWLSDAESPVFDNTRSGRAA